MVVPRALLRTFANLFYRLTIAEINTEESDVPGVLAAVPDPRSLLPLPPDNQCRQATIEDPDLPFAVLCIPVDAASRENHKAVRNERFHRYRKKVQRINTADIDSLFRWISFSFYMPGTLPQSVALAYLAPSFHRS
jgi:hypothetical protein